VLQTVAPDRSPDAIFSKPGYASITATSNHPASCGALLRAVHLKERDLQQIDP